MHREEDNQKDTEADPNASKSNKLRDANLGVS
jgi:hypothetical protein